MEKYREAKEFLLRVCETCMEEDPRNADRYRYNYNLRIDGLLNLAYFDKEVNPGNWNEIGGWKLHEDEQ